MKAIWVFCSAFLCSTALLSACASTISSPTPIPTNTATITPSPTPVPPTITPSPIPPTATSTPVPIALTDGTHTWLITSVIKSEDPISEPASGFILKPGFGYLNIELEKPNDTNIVAAIFGLDPSIGIIAIPSGITAVYVMDGQNNKYYAIEVAQTYFCIPVPLDSSNFTLYILDWDPVDLGR